MTNDALIKEACSIDKTREHWPLVKRLADALAAANAREAALRTELELVNDLRNRASDALDVCAAERDKWKGYYKRFGGCLMSCANCDVDMCGQEEIIEAGAAIFCCTQCAKDALL